MGSLCRCHTQNNMKELHRVIPSATMGEYEAPRVRPQDGGLYPLSKEGTYGRVPRNKHQGRSHITHIYIASFHIFIVFLLLFIITIIIIIHFTASFRDSNHSTFAPGFSTHIRERLKLKNTENL